MPMTVPEPVRDLCKWVPLPEAPGIRTAPHDVMCCGCRRVVPFLDASTTVPYSPVTGLPIASGYVHCKMCVHVLDATAAWMQAYRREQT